VDLVPGKSSNFFVAIELTGGAAFSWSSKWMNLRLGLLLIRLGHCTYPRTMMLMRPIRVVARLRDIYAGNGKLVRAIQKNSHTTDSLIWLAWGLRVGEAA
jgi:hypothetical protein